MSCSKDSDCDGDAVCVDGVCEEASMATATVRAGGKASGATAIINVSGGTDCAKAETESVCTIPSGGSLTLVAPAVEGHRFAGWSGPSGCTGTAPELTLKPSKAVVCIATYVAQVRVRGVVAESDETVEATSDSEGADCSADGCLVDVGAEVVLTAPSRDGARLSGWQGEGCENTDGASVTVVAPEADLECIASYITSLTVRGESAGAEVDITASSPGENAQCSAEQCAIDAGDEVTLSAPVADGRRFSGWSGGDECAGEEPDLTIGDVQTNLTCTANYLPRFSVSAKSEGAEPAAVLVAASPDALASCEGAKCEVDEGGSATLTAESVPGFRLTGFKGEGCADVSGASVTVSDVRANVECTATFETGIAVIGSVEGAQGAVMAASKSPTASCKGATCTVGPGDEVVLTAPELREHRFLGWRGDAVCMAYTKSITLKDVQTSTTCVARYASRFRVTGTADEVRGSVVAQSESLAASCAAGSCTVDEGGTVVLSAVPKSARYRFTGWSGGGGCTGSLPDLGLREVRGNITCTANFAQRVLIGATVTPQGAGTALPDGTLVPGAECEGVECAVDNGAVVPVTAVAAPGWRFVRWSGCSMERTPVIAVPIANDTICTAEFEPIKYNVTVRAGLGGTAMAGIMGTGGSCPDNRCSISVGQVVELVALPNESEGYVFTNWSGCAATPANEPLATLASVITDVTCTANFKVLEHQVTWAVEPAGAGVVEPDLASSLNCFGGPCMVRRGNSITLTARAIGNNVFAGWSGGTGCTGNNAMLTLSNVREDTRCVANFESNQVSFSATVGNADPADTNVNVVTANNAPCASGACSLMVTRGSNVVVRVRAPMATAGSLNWSGCTPTSQTVEMGTGELTYVATFNNVTVAQVCTAQLARI